MRVLLFFSSLMIILTVGAETTLVTSAPTAIKAYAKRDDSYKVILIFEDNQYTGLNPHDNATPCQFWTNSEAVFDSAVTAMAEDSGVKLVYVGRDAGASSSCQVVSLSLTE